MFNQTMFRNSTDYLVIKIMCIYTLAWFDYQGSNLRALIEVISAIIKPKSIYFSLHNKLFMHTYCIGLLYNTRKDNRCIITEDVNKPVKQFSSSCPPQTLNSACSLLAWFCENPSCLSFAYRIPGFLLTCVGVLPNLMTRFCGQETMDTFTKDINR